MKLTKNQLKDLQRDLNVFTKRSGLGVAQLIVDGDKGFATRKRIRQVKFWLGYEKKNSNNANITDDFLKQLKHPRRRVIKEEWAGQRIRRGLARRAVRRKQVAQNNFKAFLKPGVGSFDGKPVAKVAIPQLKFARANGWRGSLNSGWRDPVYSERLCLNMCGSKSCPGKCAGRSSNHVGNSPARYAKDVSDYVKYGQLMARSDCPKPRVFNALGAQDPVHYSPSGK